MNDVIKQRIGRHARPGGVVIHIVAVPTGRLLDVQAIGPEDEGKPLVDSLHVELTDEEWSMALLAYDGDTGRLIPPGGLPRKPPMTLRVLNVIGVPICVIAVILNVLAVTNNTLNGHWTRALLSAATLGVSVFCLRVQYRLRR